APLHGNSDYVRLLNPVGSERVVMRQMVLSGVLEAAAANLRHADDVRLFEIGPVYLPREKLPDEPRRLALCLTGKRRSEFWEDSARQAVPPEPLDFFDLKGIVEALVAELHLPQVTYETGKSRFLHPGRS